MRRVAVLGGFVVLAAPLRNKYPQYEGWRLENLTIVRIEEWRGWSAAE